MTVGCPLHLLKLFILHSSCLGIEQISAQCLQSTFTYMSPWVKYHAHFTDVEPEAQRGWVNHLKPHSQLSGGVEIRTQIEDFDLWPMSSYTDRMNAVWTFRDLRPHGFQCKWLTWDNPVGLGRGTGGQPQQVCAFSRSWTASSHPMPSSSFCLLLASSFSSSGLGIELAT